MLKPIKSKPFIRKCRGKQVKAMKILLVFLIMLISSVRILHKAERDPPNKGKLLLILPI